MINLAAAQRIIEIGIHKAEEVDRPSFTAAKAVAVEFLLVRGVPSPEIASGLGASLEDVGAVEHKVKSTKAKQRYQDACLVYALADGRSAEAAEYLFVRGFTRKRLQTLGFKADIKLSFIKRSCYWRTLITVEQKADEGRRSVITTEQAAVEFLLVRGVPVPEIACGLGVSFEAIHAVERTVGADKAVQRYQDACLECARADNHTRGCFGTGSSVSPRRAVGSSETLSDEVTASEVDKSFARGGRRLVVFAQSTVVS